MLKFYSVRASSPPCRRHCPLMSSYLLLSPPSGHTGDFHHEFSPGDSACAGAVRLLLSGGLCEAPPAGGEEEHCWGDGADHRGGQRNRTHHGHRVRRHGRHAGAVGHQPGRGEGDSSGG